jgi:hypothetical protein
MKLLTVSVEYDDFLAITLPVNRKHFSRVLVVTTPDDRKSQQVAMDNDAEVYCTDAFYRNEASFNKGLAVEEGWDQIGRSGWLVGMDADIVLPDRLPIRDIRPGFLYGAHRRMLADPRKLSTDLDWSVLQDMPFERAESEIPGYFQLFHAEDAALSIRPWVGINWRHAGGYDSEFQGRWPRDRKKWLGFEVLHLGLPGENWCGRTTPRIENHERHPDGARRTQLLREFMRQRQIRRNLSAEILPPLE